MIFEKCYALLVVQVNKYTKGGSHSVACFATSPAAFKTAVDVTRRKGTVVAVGLPQGSVVSRIVVYSAV